MIGQEATVSEQANKTTMSCWSPHYLGTSTESVILTY